MVKNATNSTPSNFIVRGYREGDRESCRRLWRELVEWHRKIYSDPTIGGEDLEDYFDKHLAKIGPKKIWVAIQNAGVVGFAGLMIDGEEFTIDPIVVDSAFRGKGAGAQLVRRLVAEARKLGAKHLNVEPVVRNVEAIKFYHELGFVNIGQVQLFIDFSQKTWARRLKMHNLKFDY